MRTLIVFGRIVGKEEEVRPMLQQLEKSADFQCLLMADEGQQQVPASSTLSFSGGPSFKEELMSRLKGTDIVFAAVDTLTENFASLIPTATDGIWFSGTQDLELLSQAMIAELPSLTAGATAWPIQLLGMDKSALSRFEPGETKTIEGFLASILVNGIARHEVMQRVDSNLSGTVLSEGDRAELLTFAINACNIEELFPNHAWATHEKESAAACYHALAATFITLADYDSAKECLNFGDVLEDSPRSQALKAIISNRNGELLGAVANLVNSLQQYEIRKANSNQTHYLSFYPQNIEVVNTSLKEGLNALNEQNNDRARVHFGQAIMQFDSFYSDFGLDRDFSQ